MFTHSLHLRVVGTTQRLHPPSNPTIVMSLAYIDLRASMAPNVLSSSRDTMVTPIRIHRGASGSCSDSWISSFETQPGRPVTFWLCFPMSPSRRYVAPHQPSTLLRPVLSRSGSSSLCSSVFCFLTIRFTHCTSRHRDLWSFFAITTILPRRCFAPGSRSLSCRQIGLVTKSSIASSCFQSPSVAFFPIWI